MKNLEIKIAYLDKDLKIIDRNKEFYGYFEKVGFYYTNFEDLVIPEQREAFSEFVRSTRNQNDFRSFTFKKENGETQDNIVTVGNGSLSDKKYLTLRIFEFSKVLDSFHDVELAEHQLNYVLGITSEYLFLYQKSTNRFKISSFLQKSNVILYDQDIDSWKKSIIEDDLIDKNDILEFESKIDELKACDESFSMTITTSLRFSHSMFEKLTFKGVRLEDNDEVFMVGRILPEFYVEHVEKSSEILHELKIDSLTGVYNKKTITDFAHKRFVPGTKENAMLVIVDLDHFKPVNDAYGHLAGDKVLKKAGEILKKIVGDGGIIGRYGGDEFLLILEDMNDENTFRGIFHAFISDIRAAFKNDFTDIKLTASVGAAMYPKNGKTFDELFKKADFCLYRAKDKGRDRYVFYRDDLHGELYKKASEAKTEGIKYDVREVRELKSMADFLLNLRSQPKNAVKTVLEHMLKTYNLGAINIYYGEAMQRIFCMGEESPALSDACYVYSREFAEALDGKAYIRVDFTIEMTKNAQAFGSILEKRGIQSSIQCILGTLEKPVGLVTFDRLQEGALWAEYEMNCCIMFAAALNLLPDGEIKEIFE